MLMLTQGKTNNKEDKREMVRGCEEWLMGVKNVNGCEEC